MKICNKKVCSKVITRIILFVFLLAFFAPINIKARANQPDVYDYFPTASEVDSRFLSIAGSGLNTLSGQTITLSVAFRGTESDFKIGVFDGDSSGEWDSGKLPLSYKVYADSLANGSGNKEVTQYFSLDMTDNSWSDIIVPRDEDAKTASGVYYYKLVITPTDNSDPNGSNAFKIRTNGTICINESSTFGFRSVLDSYYGYKSYNKYSDYYNDSPIVYPNYPELTPTTYDGKWKFYFDVPTEPSEITVWDGDLDYGDTYGTYKDTDDPDTPATPPSWAENAKPEGVAKGTGSSTGAPSDDNLTNTDFLRNGAINYTLITPELNSGAKDNLSFKNTNPSGNTEWEQFKVSTEAFDRSKMDYHTDKLPKGIYSIQIDGADMSNLNAWHCVYKILGVDKDGNPVPMLKPYILGNSVWEDANGNGTREAEEKGIPNVVVSLLDSKGNLLETTTTDASGYYKFPIDIGDYKVQVDTSNLNTGGALYNYKSTTGGEVSPSKTITQTDLTFNFGYKKQGNLIVKYLEEGTNSILNPKESFTKPVGEAFTTASKDIANYNLVKVTLDGVDTGSKDNVVGNYKDGNTEVIYYYKSIEPPAIKEGSLVVKYVDESGVEIASSESTTKAAGTDYTTAKKDIPNYEYVKVEGLETGKYAEGTTTVTYVYKKIEVPTPPVTPTQPEVKEGSLVVKYVDESGVEIASSESTTKAVGTDYTTAKKDIPNYEYVKVEGLETGKYAEGTTTVTYVYKKVEVPTPPVTPTPPEVKEGSLVVKYVDESGVEIASSESTTKAAGTDYTTAKKDIPNYEYVKVEGTETGKYTEGTTTVTYVYKKVEVPTPPVTPTQPEVPTPPVTPTQPEVPTPPVTPTQPEVPTESSTSKPKKPTVSVVKEGDLVVKYVDESGKEIAASETKTKAVGTEYTTTKKDISDYEYVKVEGSESGKYVEGTTRVTYVYKKIEIKEGNLIVKYLENITNKELYPEIKDKKAVGVEYTSEAKQISGYNIFKIPENAQGKYIDGTIEVIYYYTKENKDKHNKGSNNKPKDENIPEINVPDDKLAGGAPNVKKGNLIVKYLEKGTNKVLSKEIRDSKAVGIKYITNSKKIQGYSLVNMPKNSNGKYIDGTVEVVYYYEKGYKKLKGYSKSNSDEVYDPSKALPKTGEANPIFNYVFGTALIVGGTYLKKRNKKYKA